MRWTISSQQRDFFQKQLLIEFEDLLSETQTSSLAAACKKNLKQRLHLTSEEIDKKTPEEIFTNGRDLFRNDPLIKKEVCSAKLARIAAELIEKPSIRLAFDQLILSTHFPNYNYKPTNLFDEMLKKKPSLGEISSFQGLLCGLILCLSKETAIENNSDTVPSLFPRRPGCGVFFHPSLPIDFEVLYNSEDALYLMIAYTLPRTVYVLQPNDLHTHSLKALGYTFGDKLMEKFHPTLIR